MIASATAIAPHIFWVTSRAAGVAGVILSSASVGAGLLIASGRGPGRRKIGGDVRALHEALSLATLVAIAAHGVALLGDQFLHPTILDISLPFTGAYRPLWTGIGIISGWALAGLGLSYYARGRIGQSRWRALHRFTAVFWLLGIVHSLGSGSDAGQVWFLFAIGLSALPAAILLLARLSRVGAEQVPAAPRSRAPQATAPLER